VKQYRSDWYHISPATVINERQSLRSFGIRIFPQTSSSAILRLNLSISVARALFCDLANCNLMSSSSSYAQTHMTLERALATTIHFAYLLLQRCRLPLHLSRRSTTGCSQTIGAYPASFSERAPAAVECLLGPPPVSIASSSLRGPTCPFLSLAPQYQLRSQKARPARLLPQGWI
jgi:hypothetical protein